MGWVLELIGWLVGGYDFAVIYLDSNATTRVHPEVLEGMLPFLREQCWNPSSGYRAGKGVKAALGEARERVAGLIGVGVDEVVFTGGGTEANNSALFSMAGMCGDRRRLVTSAIEHSAVLRVCEFLERERGFVVEKVGVDGDGVLDLEAWGKAVAKGDVGFASLMWANNETGVIQPVKEACGLAHEHGVPFHTDAIQAVGKMPVDTLDAGVDFLSVSAHKFHGPKGVGALYVRKGVAFEPLLLGGGQEGGRRSGTENVASIVGMGCAAELMRGRLEMDGHDSVKALRDHFEERILGELEGVVRNGSLERRTKNTSHLSFEDCEAAGLLILLDEYGMACSAGSACMTGKQQPSHVQKAMGFSDERARSSLRISFSILTTREETDAAVEMVKKAVGKLRSVQGAGGVGPVSVYS